MRRIVAAAVMMVLAAEGMAFAVGKDKAMYVGGTLSSIPERTEGVLTTSDEERVLFIGEKGAGILEIPWKSITEAEYGQKVGRRWRTAILLSPLALFSKGRKHYLTLSYKDPKGNDQAAIIELGKDTVRTTLTIVEARTGQKVTVQDEEAAKARGN